MRPRESAHGQIPAVQDVPAAVAVPRAKVAVCVVTPKSWPEIDSGRTNAAGSCSAARGTPDRSAAPQQEPEAADNQAIGECLTACFRDVGSLLRSVARGWVCSLRRSSGLCAGGEATAR